MEANCFIFSCSVNRSIHSFMLSRRRLWRSCKPKNHRWLLYKWHQVQLTFPPQPKNGDPWLAADLLFFQPTNPIRVGNFQVKFHSWKCNGGVTSRISLENKNCFLFLLIRDLRDEKLTRNSSLERETRLANQITDKQGLSIPFQNTHQVLSIVVVVVVEKVQVWRSWSRADKSATCDKLGKNPVETHKRPQSFSFTRDVSEISHPIRSITVDQHEEVYFARFFSL